MAVAIESPATTTTAEGYGLESLLERSLESTITTLDNATRDVGLPLDRLSLAANLAAWTLRTGNATFLPAIAALQSSLEAEPRNANGGLWYYDNPGNFTAYRNLSYLDGMYSVAPFVTIHALLGGNKSEASMQAALHAALEQVQILHDICVKPSGLLVHGYDALKAHAWANPTTGASPEVWGRSLAWYSLGLLNTLEIARTVPELERSKAFVQLRRLFQKAMDAQIRAVRYSKAITEEPGVWQVVDRPGEPGNFVEASSSFLTVYTLLRGTRLGFLDTRHRQSLKHSNTTAIAQDIYQSVSQKCLVTHDNGSLSLNGTSEIASLSSQNVSYEYYVTRQRVVDSLIGTSGFVLASLEMARLETSNATFADGQ